LTERDAVGGFGDGDDRIADVFGPDGGYGGDVPAGFLGESGPEVFSLSVCVSMFLDITTDSCHENVFAQVF